MEDNSDIPERFVLGNFTRLSLGITIPDAYLWDIRVKDTVSIGGYTVEPVEEEPTPAEEEQDDSGRKGIVIREDIKV